MKQIDAKTSRLRSLGGFMFLFKTTLGLFGIVLFAIALFGWYELVFWRYIPSWWVFVALLAVVFAAIAALQYFVLTPVEFAFVSRQSYAHDNPYAEDVRAIRELLEREFPMNEPGEWAERSASPPTSSPITRLTHGPRD